MSQVMLMLRAIGTPTKPKQARRTQAGNDPEDDSVMLTAAEPASPIPQHQSSDHLAGEALTEAAELDRMEEEGDGSNTAEAAPAATAAKVCRQTWAKAPGRLYHPSNLTNSRMQLSPIMLITLLLQICCYCDKAEGEHFGRASPVRSITPYPRPARRRD